MRWTHGCALLLAGGVLLVPSVGHAQSYMRMSPQEGHPTFFGEVLMGIPNEWYCWAQQKNEIKPRESGTGCVYYQGVDFRYWRVNPPTKNSGSNHTVYYWVQGTRYSAEVLCFGAYSYSNNGNDYSNTPATCPTSIGAYDVSMAGLTVPAYGTTNIVAAWLAIAPGATHQSAWHGVSWNYN